MGNNHIADLFAIFPLKELPRLIIFDLTGNAVCKIPTYRLFTLFHLSRLKIMNGSGVTAREQNQARDEFMGKLTIELLGEKIGHFTFKNITELDLRNCKIREVDCLSNGDFRNLRKLNFDNNLLVNIDCFGGLTGLRYLSLNHNKLERLLSTDQPANNMSCAITKSDYSEYGKPALFLSHLEELHLGYNMITRIADLALWRMPQLRILFLQGNRISKVSLCNHR
jgi:Leucine-rich repeat (LRR) protein